MKKKIYLKRVEMKDSSCDGCYFIDKDCSLVIKKNKLKCAENKKFYIYIEVDNGNRDPKMV